MSDSSFSEPKITQRITQGEFEIIAAQPGLLRLYLEDARSLTDLSPIAGTSLQRLVIDRPFGVQDLSPLATLTSLAQLRYGNSRLGDDRAVVLHDLQWVRPLAQLRKIEFVGTRLLDPDLSPLLDLRDLRDLSMPLRRAYRKQVFEFAPRSTAFASLAARYEDFDSYRNATR